MTKSKRAWLAVIASLSAFGVAGAYLLMRPSSFVVRTETYDVTVATESQLTKTAGLKIFFGHQSVGANFLGAVPAVFSSAAVDAPAIIDSEDQQTASGAGYIQHALVGQNGKPLGKIEEFDRVIRAGVGNEVDIAALKLCYIDLHSGDDTGKVFEAYRSTLAHLERDYPDVTFVYMTAPLTTEQGLIGRFKDRIGIGHAPGPEDNVAREQFNARIRAEYISTGRLFDIAAIQSTAPDGTRLVRNYSDADYYALEDALAKDPGHLNSVGSERVASAFLATLARVSGPASQ